jgi:hypothetical protein
MLEFLKKIFRNKERSQEEILASIRREFLFWGYDTSDLSDEELRRRILENARAISQLGVTREELLKACKATLKVGGTLSRDP